MSWSQYRSLPRSEKVHLNIGWTYPMQVALVLVIVAQNG